MQSEIDRCLKEISEIEALILSGHPDLEGLCLALSDWWMELRILQNEKRRQAEAQRRISSSPMDQAFTE
jgi:hypothetical protein